MESFCAMEREDYKRKQARKPPSFLSKKEQQLMKLAEEFLSKNNRKSYTGRKSRVDRVSLGPIRLSNQLRPINKDNNG
jgi:hypothetical protein